MANIRISSTSAGTSPFTFTVNPISWEIPSGTDKQRIQILHGAAAYQESYFDSRERYLIWRGMYATATYDNTGFVEKLASARTWIGSIRYIDFGNINDLTADWPSTAQWKKCRIVDVIATYSPANVSGIPIYEEVRIVIQPEEV